ncbi:MAG: FtsW/RodA/SpoVE family cell cycle protein [Spirochaetales bacterium]|nr:FtsW/RodA/SpoVE family cell cycle protein [Spirochaetales bacterium]
MARTSYDDWNFMGEARREETKTRSAHSAKTRQINNQRNSFIFLCIVILLTLMGLVCVYSASFEEAVSRNLPHYHYLLRQGIYVAVGIGLMVLVNLIPEIALKVVSPIMFFVCIVLLAIDTIWTKNLLINSDTIGFLFLSGVMYMSLFFSGRGNRIEKATQLIPPVLGCIIVLVLILLRRNFSFALMYLALSVTMFAAGGVGLLGVILLVLYAAVPVACILLSKSERIISIAEFLIPGLGSNPRTDSILAAKSAIASGSWFGKGLGGGVFKNGIIGDLSGKNILACICEELGFWGIVLIVLFIAFYAFVGYMAAKNIRSQNGYFSNLAIGISTMVVWQFILNVCWVLGYLNAEALPLPFFSYGLGIIPILLESGILFRITRVKIDAEESEKVMASIQDELMFPERYDFENR